jgi:hypothetical protein
MQLLERAEVSGNWPVEKYSNVVDQLASSCRVHVLDAVASASLNEPV